MFKALLRVDGFQAGRCIAALTRHPERCLWATPPPKLLDAAGPVPPRKFCEKF
jgi:hypothetical protein